MAVCVQLSGCLGVLLPFCLPLWKKEFCTFTTEQISRKCVTLFDSGSDYIRKNCLALRVAQRRMFFKATAQEQLAYN